MLVYFGLQDQFGIRGSDVQRSKDVRGSGAWVAYLALGALAIVLSNRPSMTLDLYKQLLTKETKVEILPIS